MGSGLCCCMYSSTGVRPIDFGCTFLWYSYCSHVGEAMIQVHMYEGKVVIYKTPYAIWDVYLEGCVVDAG